MAYFFMRAERDHYRITSKKRFFYVVLGFIFLIGFLEEISWGQRIFDLQIPNVLSGQNLQNEINIHNLEWFQGKYIFLHVDSLFTLFWLTLCVIIPLLYKLYAPVRSLINRFNLPLVPVSLSLLFLINWLSQFVTPNPVPARLLYPLEEIRESNFSFLFMCFAIFELYQLRSARST
jgi:hypothetical protein